MVKFTKSEIKILEKTGYEKVSDNEYIMGNSWCETTIIKDSEDEFTYHFNVFPNEYFDDVDLEMANNNETEYGLTWEELVEKLSIEA